MVSVHERLASSTTLPSPSPPACRRTSYSPLWYMQLQYLHRGEFIWVSGQTTRRLIASMIEPTLHTINQKIERRVRLVIDKIAEAQHAITRCGIPGLTMRIQDVPDGRKESPGGHGSLLDSCQFLTPLDMIVQKQLGGKLFAGVPLNESPALKKVDIGIVVDDSTNAARSASDIVLTEPGLSVIISVVLTSQPVFQRMKNYSRVFHVESLEKMAQDNFQKLAAAMYLQVSTINQALIFFTRSCRWSFMERPGFLLVFAFLVTQLIATLITVYVDWRFTTIKGIGWGWDGVTWLYNIVFYLPLDVIKFLIRYMMRGRAWDLDLERRIVFMRKKDFRQEERELKWAIAQRTIGGLQPTESTTFHGMNNYIELNQLAEEAHGRAEIARLRELNTMKGRTKLVVRLKGLNLKTIRQSYSVLLVNGDIEALVTYARGGKTRGKQGLRCDTDI